MIYLASPYTHDDPDIRAFRLRVVQEMTAKFMSDGEHVYSPIAHTAPISEAFNAPVEFEFYRDFDFDMIERCDFVHVVKLPGWRESVGVTAEIEFALKKWINVEYVLPFGDCWDTYSAMKLMEENLS